MIELVFVIVVIGILAATIMPSTKTNPLKEAAIQVVSHIRYTQHLALVDDKFKANDGSWYKKRWQIAFVSSDASDNKPSYTIYSDTSGTSTGDANEVEVAKNPMNFKQRLTGGYTGADALNINKDAFVGMKKLNLGLSYGVENVDFATACAVSGSTRIAFDYLGRPIKGKLGGASGGGNTKAYEDDNLIQQQCVITLFSSSSSIKIAVEPETGYTCILNSSSECI